MSIGIRLSDQSGAAQYAIDTNVSMVPGWDLFSEPVGPRIGPLEPRLPGRQISLFPGFKALKATWDWVQYWSPHLQRVTGPRDFPFPGFRAGKLLGLSSLFSRVSLETPFG